MRPFFRLIGLLGCLVGVAAVVALVGASWGHWGGVVAFQRTTEGQLPDVYVVDVLTRVTVNLTQHPGNDRFPSWSPDGTELMIQAYRPEQRNIETIFRVPFSTRGVATPVLPEGVLGVQPDWSPDGCCVAFSAYDTATYSNNIHVMRLADGALWNAAPIPGLSQFAPAWSPDGDTIATAAGSVDGYLTQRIVVIPVDTTAGQPLGRRETPRVLSVSPAAGYVTPAWTPDGDSLLFVNVGMQLGDLYQSPVPLPELDGYPPPTPQTVVTANQRVNYPAVSPDGEWIVYSDADRRDTNSTVLYISRSNGTGQRQLTFREGYDVQDTAPAWRPVGKSR